MLAPPDISDDKVYTRDYKELLIEQQQAKQQAKNITISEIRELNDIRARAIAAMLYADISQRDIARLLKLTIRRVRQIIQ
jgi:DNA-directed RNA polymerase specialized sigma subunit